jgi:uncharacterized protein YkwD
MNATSMHVISISALLWTLLLPVHAPSQEVEGLKLDPQQLEIRLTDWLNRERDLNGLTILTRDETLGEIARFHCRKMAAENKLSHHFPDYPPLNQRAADAGLYFTRIGENVASGETFVMRFVHQALMDSPEHRKNILLPEYSHLGIGIIKQDEIYYTTQVFARMIQPRTADEIEGQLIWEIGRKVSPDRLPPMLNTPELKTLCRKRSEGFMNGMPMKDLSDRWPWGKAELVSHTFAMPDEVIEKLLSGLISQPQSWILGAAFGRTAANPGGIHSVTLITFPRLVTMDDPAQYLFDRLNRERDDRARITARWSDTLAKIARDMAGAFRFSSRIMDYPSNCKICFVYETADLPDLPTSLLDLMKEKSIKTLGIHVLAPKAHIYNKNTLIVAVVGK